MFEKKKKHFLINDEFIKDKSNGSMEIIEPVWYSVSIYDGVEKYEKDLGAFSIPQRYVFAIEWYNAEVCNGGHDQFYGNSTGIVWEDVMNGLKTIGAKKHYDIIKKSIKKMGGNPSKDSEEREEKLEELEPDFEKLDMKFYELDEELDEKLQKYILDNAKDFYFDGVVTID
ncbi:MAG: DMP19 family protein [Firmicutes bacterium]|nr:DMP19 family protein [Bacillota bacterium]